MIKEIEQLRETLVQENNMYGEVLKLEKEKTEVIRKGKLKELEQMTRKEQQFLMMMGTFERIRRSVFVNVAEELGIESLDGLSEFLLHVSDEAIVEEIDGLRNQILSKIQGIKEANALNEKLMEQHLDYIHFSIEMMTNQTQDQNYGNKAQAQGKRKSNLFDARV